PLGTVGAPRLSYGVRSELTLSDNLQHYRSDRARSDARLEVTPYVMASSERPRARYQLSYQMRNFAYARDDRDQLFRHNLSGDGSFALAGDKLWVDVRAFMGSVADDISGDLSDDPLSSFSNSGRYRNFTISPWYQDRIGSLATYQLRYSHTRSSGSQSLNYAESNQSASAIVDGIDRGAAWNWRWFGTFQRNDFRGGFERDRRHSGMTVFYRVGHRLRLSGGLEYEQIDGVRNDDGDDYGWGPSFGFDWNPNARLSLSANIAERFYGTTGSARLAWTLARSTLGMQYHRLMMSSADGSLLAMDPGAMTSNPIGRPNTIIGDLLSRGILLPEGLRLSPSFLTDAAVLENRLTAFWALAGAGRSLTLSLYLSNRETRAEIPGLNTGGGIRGSAGLSSTGFSGEVEERGAVLGYQQSLGARSQLSASIARRYVESPTADFENQLTTVQAGLSSRIDRGTTVFGGLRHSTQSTRGRGTASPYDENAIYGGVDFRFR
ncbi:MAG: TIGR03016 family PEP-CTERM system-associated outer membrane protein, partial [Burkholderiaceae bacterium]